MLLISFYISVKMCKGFREASAQGLELSVMVPSKSAIGCGCANLNMAHIESPVTKYYSYRYLIDLCLNLF
jgi:hypothetical protein